MLIRLQNVLILLAIGAFLATAIAAEVLEASNRPHIAIYQKATTHELECTDSQSVQECTEEAIATYNKFLAIFTAILAVATVGLGFATIGLYFVSQRQLRHAETESRRGRAWRLKDEGRIVEQFEIARKNAEAAKESADAAKVQARVASDTLANVQRPYVYVFGADRLLTSPEVPALTPYVEYSVVNYGQTPAVIEIVNVGYFSGQTPEIPLRVDFDHQLVISPIMPPHDRRDMREPILEQFIGENLGVIVDLVKQTTHPLPRLTPNESLFFRVMVSYSGPFVQGYETSTTWIWSSSVDRFVELNDPEYTYAR
jgi:hypothetical protein